MIIGAESSMVFVSDLLGTRFPALLDGLRRILADHGIPMGVIQGTRDVWCRDYMPVEVAPREFVRFRYEPDYLKGHEHLITRPADVGDLPVAGRCVASEIVLDGGNVVGWGARCIVTEKVFRDDRDMGREELTRALRQLLRVDDLIVIRTEPYDVVGHADGVVRFLDERTVVINDYAEVCPWYRRRLTAVLRRSGLQWVELPYAPADGRRGEIPPATGNYVNFLRVGGLVVLPSYGFPEDEDPRRLIEDTLIDATVTTLDWTGLADEGGALNCATWDVFHGDSEHQRHGGVRCPICESW